MSSAISYSQCPGEVYDEHQSLSELDDSIDLDKLMKTSQKNYIVVYCHKYDLTTLKKKFSSIEEALEYALNISKEDFIVNSVITDNYRITV